MTYGGQRPRGSLAGRALQQATGLVSDRLYLRLLFRRTFGYWPDLRSPRTFNEKLLVYKLVTRGDRRLPPLVDKIEAKLHAASRIGERHVTPTLWQGSSLPPRDERRWPIPYVIKASNGSGQNYFVRSPEEEDWDRIERLCARWRQVRHGRGAREWPYDPLPARILVEPYLGAGESYPIDYRFYTFGGEVKLIQLELDRGTARRRAMFTPAWQRLPFEYSFPDYPGEIERPPALKRMIEMAERLAAGFMFVRVDLYLLEEQPRFGEMTFFPGGGCGVFSPSEADLEIGKLWCGPISAFPSPGDRERVRRAPASSTTPALISTPPESRPR